MKRAACLLLLAVWALPLCGQVRQTPVFTVAAGSSIVVPRPGVTAAYSIDPGTAEAEAVPGGFRLTGKTPGQTTVIVVTLAATQAVAVTVPLPPHAHIAGVRGAGSEDQTVEFGDEQIRYNNNPNEFAGVEEVTQIAGERQIHVEIMNTDVFPSSGESPVGFPMLSYSISRPGHDLTLMDQLVDNTPLTLDHIYVRGVHLRQGAWDFQTGITSLTAFQDFLLPSNRWEIAGLSRNFRLNSHSFLRGSFYYFSTNTTANPGATPGGIGTIYYQYARPRGIHLSAELGIGDGVALAATFQRDGKKQQIQGEFYYQSPRIATLAMTELHGRTANFNWSRQFSRRWQSTFYVIDTDVNLPIEKQQVDSASLNQTYWLTHHVGATAGMVASRYISILPSAPTVSSAGYVFGPQLQWKYLGGSFQYQRQNNGGSNPPSNGFMYNVHSRLGSLNASAFYDTQSETPVLSTVQSSAVPGLSQALSWQSQAAAGASQMSQFLQQTSVLSTQGYIPPITVALATLRDQYGISLQWASRRAGQLNFNGLVNTSEGGGMASERLSTGGLIWTRKLGESNLVNVGFSLYRSTSAGSTTLQPVEQFSLQHQIDSIPRWLVPGRRGTISGHVFVDKTYAQVYQKGDTPIPGVLIYLDGRRSTHTDSNGYYAFRGVPFGMHSVEADYRGDRSYFFTSSSPRSVAIGATADFGISFAKGRIFGSFVNDAGDGLQVQLSLTGPGIQRDIQTDGDGQVEVQGLPDGTYTLHPIDTSLPPGYSLGELADQTVRVTAAQAGHFTFRIHAQRSISGRILLLDPRTGKRLPLAGLSVSLGPDGPAMRTDSDGRYLFRHLAAGSWQVTVAHDGNVWRRSVPLNSGPDIETGVDITIVDAARPVATPQPSPSIAPPPVLFEQNRRNRPQPQHPPQD